MNPEAVQHTIRPSRPSRVPLPAQIVRMSDGYQPHLVSPEAGLRKLVETAIERLYDPVSMAVRRVHQVLVDAARSADAKDMLHVFCAC